MEELLKAIAAHPERFLDNTYLPCGLRAVADALADVQLERSRSQTAGPDFTAA